MNKLSRAEFYRRLQAANPAPTTELKFNSPFELLVAVVLSAQATDVGVNRATGPLFAVADTPHKMVALGEAHLKEFIKTIGLFNTKAKNVIALSEILLREHGGEVVFMRRVQEGAANQSFGLQVAALAGLPRPVINAARRHL